MRASWLVVLMLAPLVHAETPEPCASYTVPAFVLDSGGNALRGLSRENFTLTFKSQPAKLLTVEPMTRGYRVAVVLDTSGSMKKAAAQQTVLNSMAGLLQNLPLDTQVAFISFADQVNSSLPFGTPPMEIVKAIKDIFADTKRFVGRTALLDAIDHATKMFDKPRIGDTIVVFSDGADNRSKLTDRNLKRELTPSAIRIFSILNFVDEQSNPDEVRGPYLMSELANETGGNVYIENGESDPPHSAPGTGAQVRGMILARAVTATYLIRFESSSTLPSEKLKIEVRDDNREKKKKKYVFYPKHYLFCDAPASAEPTRHN